MDSLLLWFGAPELEAMQRFNAAEAVIDEWAIGVGLSERENAVLDAFSAELTSAFDFLQARLERLIPDRVDVIRWILDFNTLEQAQATAKAAAGR